MKVQWLFFDIGSTLMDERMAYEHRLREIGGAANVSYENVLDMALSYYKQNKKGDYEAARQLGVELPQWHSEDEILYADADRCLKVLSRKYKIGIIANQSPGTAERLQQHGILQYMDIVVASAEEGIAKPDRRIFEIALERSKCEPNQAVMIGDRIDNDIMPANMLGMHTIWIKQGFGKYWNILHDNEKAEYTINSLMELCGIL